MALLAPSSVMARPPRSVLVGKQNGDHALGHSWIGRIGRVVHQGRIEVIDLEKDRLSVGLERPEIMFFVWVIGVTKIVIHRDSCKYAPNIDPTSSSAHRVDIVRIFRMAEEPAPALVATP